MLNRFQGEASGMLRRLFVDGCHPERSEGPVFSSRAEPVSGAGALARMLDLCSRRHSEALQCRGISRAVTEFFCLKKTLRLQARLFGLPIRMTPAEQNIFLAINPELGIRARIVAF